MAPRYSPNDEPDKLDSEPQRATGVRTADSTDEQAQAGSSEEDDRPPAE